MLKVGFIGYGAIAQLAHNAIERISQTHCGPNYQQKQP